LKVLPEKVSAHQVLSLSSGAAGACRDSIEAAGIEPLDVHLKRVWLVVRESDNTLPGLAPFVTECKLEELRGRSDRVFMNSEVGVIGFGTNADCDDLGTHAALD
jgi:hypothetical protein